MSERTLTADEIEGLILADPDGVTEIVENMGYPFIHKADARGKQIHDGGDGLSPFVRVKHRYGDKVLVSVHFSDPVHFEHDGKDYWISGDGDIELCFEITEGGE
jgi:hypothetical protein